MSDNTTKITYGDYFNVSNCPCLKNYKSKPVAEVPCIWYPYSPCGPVNEDEEPVNNENPFSFESNGKFKPEELSSDKCTCLSKEEKARLEYKGPVYDCIIMIQIENEQLSDEKEMNHLQIVVDKFKDTHEICLLCKESLNTVWYNEHYGYDFSIMNIRDDYEERPYMDSRLYNALRDYEYMLRVGLNCEIMGDSEDLCLFMERKQDYISAPFTREEVKDKCGIDGIFCGYGDLSLRKICIASDVCNILKNVDVVEHCKVNDDEDSVFSFGVFAFKKCCLMNLSRMFAIADNDNKEYWMEKNNYGEPFGYIH